MYGGLLQGGNVKINFQQAGRHQTGNMTCATSIKHKKMM
jgi:hypothetical protein